MRFHYLGTASGVEPFPDMHHQSWVLEVNGINYWFDAGENCAHRAHTSGIDVMNTAAVFISHPHPDHYCGLPNLFFCLQKITVKFKKQMIKGKLQLFFSEPALLQAMKSLIFRRKKPPFNPIEPAFTLEECPMHDGLLYSDENVTVSALHNRHMGEDGSEGWHSYSFLIEAEGKRIVFSGDVKSPEELDELIGDGCDQLIMETGHHVVEDVLNYALSRKVRRLRLTHHGRSILENRPFYEALAQKFSSENAIDVRLCYDGMTEEI